MHEKGGSDKNPGLEENTITGVLKCGIIYRGQIIRKAKVSVAQNKKRSRDKQE
jgi:molecular chaperone GrpE (heat shock protein)